MNNDGEWEIFLGALWRYQYTQKETALTKEVADCLHHACAGITDYGVKILMLAQNRAILSGVEAITCGMIESVVKDQLETSRPFLEAVRSRDYTRIGNFEDIRPLDVGLCMAKDRSEKGNVIVAVPEEPLPVPRLKRPAKEDRKVGGTILEVFIEAHTEKRDPYETFRDRNLIGDAYEFLH
jgi:hypothetical protein